MFILFDLEQKYLFDLVTLEASWEHFDSLSIFVRHMTSVILDWTNDNWQDMSGAKAPSSSISSSNLHPIIIHGSPFRQQSTISVLLPSHHQKSDSANVNIRSCSTTEADWNAWPSGNDAIKSHQTAELGFCSQQNQTLPTEISILLSVQINQQLFRGARVQISCSPNPSLVFAPRIEHS